MCQVMANQVLGSFGQSGLVILIYTGQLINIYWPVSPYTTPSFAKKPAPGAARALPRPRGPARARGPGPGPENVVSGPEK